MDTLAPMDLCSCALVYLRMYVCPYVCVWRYTVHICVYLYTPMHSCVSSYACQYTDGHSCELVHLLGTSLCILLCICIHRAYGCVCVHLCIVVYSPIHQRLSAYGEVQWHIFQYTLAHGGVYSDTLCTFVCMYIHLCMWVYVCIHRCVYTGICVCFCILPLVGLARYTS